MKFSVEINVMPLKALLDPQGKAVNQTMKNIGFKTVENVRIGKHIIFELEAENKKKAEAMTEEACKKILINPIMESFEYTVKEVKK
ncbi:MAG: phosphoribosylformylglycinamidine synthase, purS protein [Bacteroidetes bacterium GWF2_38_335]|nr:MAG: phosphoribosylformylglycinamidine synthase, purS protein [Bacteroidetes bacterium GWF2_38_335]OFY78142.1 MAG: phosphoribosylformylglycinamidine synthase, purS protein [Bacteroidetes bacterium RIFOXYA12_FULL_38_20]HBS88703.1 phosphoribosylformylglycinamidine synthase [Bacteroidales bacterium]